MNETHIIIVEDEVKIAQILVDYLEQDGFQVTALHEGTHAVEIIKAKKPDFIILDLMLPGKDGLSICQEVRQFSNLPIMMLTAKVDEIDRLLGLKIGADDYVCKPFLPREVVARVHTILRRTQRQQVSDTEHNDYSYQGITIYPDRYLCMVDKHEIELTPVEFRLLQTLMSNPGRVFSRNDLMHSSYLDERIVSDRTIDSHIKNLRKKLSLDLNEREIIHSIYGVGYKLE